MNNSFEKTFKDIIENLENTKDKNGNNLKMSAIIVSRDGETLTHYFEEREQIDIRSIAKPIVCIAFGIAIDEGLYFDKTKITLDTQIGPLVQKYAELTEENRKKWNIITLRDCFKITLGHDKGIMFSKDVKDQDENRLVEYVLNYPIPKMPGVDFVYSNAGTFILSTLVSEYLGISLDDFVYKYLFSKLKIEDYTWKKYGKYCAGCTGLKMYCEDLHKITKLLLNYGLYENQRIVSEKWIKNMTLPLVQMPTHRYKKGRAFPKMSYGLNLWICGDIDNNGIINTSGIFYCDGTDGQYSIVIPYNKTAITVMAKQPDTEPISNLLGVFKL